MLVGEFLEDSVLWYWYDSWLAIVGLVLAGLFTLQVLFKTRWSNPVALFFKLVAMAGTAIVALIVIDRFEVETLSTDDLDADLYAYASIVGAGVAVVLGLYATLFVKGGGSRAPRRVDLAMAGGDGEGGTTMVLTVATKTTAWLLVRRGGEPGQTFNLEGDRLVIGSSRDSDIRMEHTSVSPQHALICNVEGRYLLSDLASESGSWVDGDSVTGIFIHNGSQIIVGETELFFTEVSGEDETDAEGTATQGVLLVRSGAAMGQQFRVSEDDLVIGREPGQDGAKIDDTAVSRLHALVRWTSHGFVVYDLGSANGTIVDGATMEGRQLVNGDVIQLGETELQFVESESGQAREEPSIFS